VDHPTAEAAAEVAAEVAEAAEEVAEVAAENRTHQRMGGNRHRRQMQLANYKKSGLSLRRGRNCRSRYRMQDCKPGLHSRNGSQ
jgi:hypothetical protein